MSTARPDWESEYFRVQRDPAYLEYAARRIADADIHVEGKDVLDVGCGPGVYIHHLLDQRPRSIVGVDPSVTYLTGVHQAEAAARLVVGSAHGLPFRAETFDVVLLLDTLLHLDAGRAVGELTRVLRPGGVLWITHKLSGYYWWKLRYRKGRSARVYAVEGLSSLKRLVEPLLPTARRSTYTTPARFARLLAPLRVERQTVRRVDGIASEVEAIARKPE